MKRKILSGILACFLALSACGCDNMSLSRSPESESKSEIETVSSEAESVETEEIKHNEPPFSLDRSAKISMDISGIDTTADIFSVPSRYKNNYAAQSFYLGDSVSTSINKWVEKNFTAIINMYLEKEEVQLVTDADIQAEVEALYQRHIALNDYFRYIEVENPTDEEIKPENYYKAVNTISGTKDIRDLYYRYEKVYSDVGDYNKFCKDFVPISFMEDELYVLGSTIISDGKKYYTAVNTFAGSFIPVDSVYGKTENFRSQNGGNSAIALKKGDNVYMAFVQINESCVHLYAVPLKENIFGQLRISRNMNPKRAFSGSYGSGSSEGFTLSGGTEINNEAGYYSDDEVIELEKPTADYALLEYELHTTGSHEFTKWATANSSALFNRALAANPDYVVVGDFAVQNSIKQLYANHTAINGYFSKAVAKVDDYAVFDKTEYYKMEKGIPGIENMQQLYELEAATYSDITTYENFSNKFSPIKIENGSVYALGSVLKGEIGNKYLSVNSFLGNNSAFDLNSGERFNPDGHMLCYAVEKDGDVYMMFLSDSMDADYIQRVRVCIAKTAQNELGEYRIYRNTDWNNVF